MDKIFLYNDEGVSLDSLEHMRLSIKEIAGVEPAIVDAKTLNAGDWQRSTPLLIIPGGRDRFYHQSLTPDGTRHIKEFVENGGTYLGICAGAYFGCACIEFEKGGELEVSGKRDLGFFPGIAIGPAYGLGIFRYDGSAGARAGRILFSDGLKTAAYFHGGCFFEDPHKYSNVEVMARYEDLPGQPAAIVDCKIGKGKAILSGIHLEYSPRLLPLYPDNLSQIRTTLLESDAFRTSALKRILMTNQ